MAIDGDKSGFKTAKERGEKSFSSIWRKQNWLLDIRVDKFYSAGCKFYNRELSFQCQSSGFAIK